MERLESMSTERECFKQMSLLAKKRDQDQADYETQGGALVLQALGEFQKDHPEVQRLEIRLSQNYFRKVQLKVWLQDGRVETVSSFSRRSQHQKLAVCLEALEDNLGALRDLVEVKFSSSITILNPYGKSP